MENLRRVYTKEHAELLELRETLMQNERSFGSHTERGKNINADLKGSNSRAAKHFYSLQMISATRSSRRRSTTK